MKKSIFALLLLSALISGGCAKQDKTGYLENDGKSFMYLFIQNAKSGSFVAVEEGNLYTLTLKGVYPQTVFFSDRPKRIAGQVNMTSFLKNTRFSKDNPPNAALEILDADEDSDVIILELFDPVYDYKKQTLQYSAKILKNDKHSIAVYNERNDKMIPKVFGEATLFIDDYPYHPYE